MDHKSAISFENGMSCSSRIRENGAFSHMGTSMDVRFDRKTPIG